MAPGPRGRGGPAVLVLATTALVLLALEDAFLPPLMPGSAASAFQPARQGLEEEAPSLLRNEESCPRRSLVVLVAASLGTLTLGLRAWADAPADPSVPQPTQEELQAIAGAFAALAADPARPNAKAEVERAEETLGRAIARYEGPLKRGQEERALLRMGRARSRVMQNDIALGKRPEKAAEAVEDLDVAIGIMEDDFRRNPGKALYSEYPDALVRRALAKEEIKAWEGAVADYSRAIVLWRPPPGRPDVPLRGDARPAEGDGLGVNPLVLNFRGNALSQLGRYEEALADYQEATEIFLNDGELRQASLSRANEALALFGAGRREEAVGTMQAVIRKDPGVTDMHVALAAVYWSQGKVGRAEGEWQFACEKISTGCQQYKDLQWVTEIRRWPPSLVSELRSFLAGAAVA